MEINTDTDTTLVKEMTFIIEILQSMVKTKFSSLEHSGMHPGLFQA